MKSLHGKKILIVEDDDMLRELLVDLFRYAEAEVRQASNGTEAIKIIREFHIDAVITDVRMPGGDGIQLAKDIQTLVQPRPFVFICSGFNDLTKDMISQLNIVKVFSKPFDRDELTNTVMNSVCKDQ